MRKPTFALIMMLFFASYAQTAELIEPDDTAQAIPQADTYQKQTEDLNYPDRILETDMQVLLTESAYFGRMQDRPVSTHKVNYVSIDNYIWEDSAQINFQFSMKFLLVPPDLQSRLNSMYPIYFAYTQKSLWNIGAHSSPFVESNYNPEILLDYSLNKVIYGPLHLRNIVISPFEHESNGLSTNLSRAWNRQYVMASFGLPTEEVLTNTNTFIRDKAYMYVKIWHASGYLALEHYLQSIGSQDHFLDYMGSGEVGLSVRNILWSGDNQLDVKTPIFRHAQKDSYRFEFRQQIPGRNYALYIQYWLGYGETLLRFDQYGHKVYIGFSASN